VWQGAGGALRTGSALSARGYIIEVLGKRRAESRGVSPSRFGGVQVVIRQSGSLEAEAEAEDLHAKTCGFASASLKLPFDPSPNDHAMRAWYK
jgi:hypothetical protein